MRSRNPIRHARLRQIAAEILSLQKTAAVRPTDESVLPYPAGTSERMIEALGAGGRIIISHVRGGGGANGSTTRTQLGNDLRRVDEELIELPRR